MKKTNFLNSCNSNKNAKCNAIQSLFEVEHFLRKLSCVKNSLCFANKAKCLINNKNKKF